MSDISTNTSAGLPQAIQPEYLVTFNLDTDVGNSRVKPGLQDRKNIIFLLKRHFAYLVKVLSVFQRLGVKMGYCEFFIMVYTHW